MVKEAVKVIKKQGVLLFLLFTLMADQKLTAQTVSPADKICGKWISEQKNCIVQVYRNGNEFNAKLVWFDDSDDRSQAMNVRTDYKNPDPALRNRKLIGMEVLEDLTYNPGSKTWENGMIYDAKSGKKWSSAAALTANNTLKVTGYWHFKFLGKTMVFNRM